MEEALRITIKAERGDHITFVLRKQYFDAGSEWVSSIVNVKAGSFQGFTEACFDVRDCERLASELDKLYSSFDRPAQFRTAEDQVRLDFNINDRGCIALNGVVMDAAGVGNEFRFVFELDQSFLPAIIRDLQRVEALRTS